MTVNEAKGWLIELKDCEETQEFYYADCVIEAFDIAIEALEEIQQYRAIGTVERLKHLEEYVDTINKLCADYSAIGTIDEFKALKEKSVPKKVVVEHIPKTSWTKEVSHYLCPSCRSIFSFGGNPYCSNCGQKIDWK